MATVAIVPTPEGDGEGEETWESALLEIQRTLSEGFNSLREELRLAMAKENPSLSQLLEANTRLTEMIAQNNNQQQTNNTQLVERLALLTPQTPTPIVEVVIPPSDTLNLEGGEIDPSEVAPEPAPAARRKRRIL